jgi:hypothetical protein
MEAYRKIAVRRYNIEAQPHMGYKLVSIPNRLLPEEVAWKLGTHIIGKKIYSYQSTSSTMDVANQLANSGAAEGTVVFAEHQSKGRGRLGREWISPKEKGIYVLPFSHLDLFWLGDRQQCLSRGARIFNEATREIIAIQAYLTLARIILRNLEAEKHDLPDECVARIIAVLQEMSKSEEIAKKTKSELLGLAKVFKSRLMNDQEEARTAEIDKLIAEYSKIFRSTQLEV